MGLLQGHDARRLFRGLLLACLIISWPQTVAAQSFGQSMMRNAMLGDSPLLSTNSLHHPYSFNLGQQMLFNTPIYSSRKEPHGKYFSSSQYDPHKPNSYYGNGPKMGTADYESRNSRYGPRSYPADHRPQSSGYGLRSNFRDYGSQNRGYGPTRPSRDYRSQSNGYGPRRQSSDYWPQNRGYSPKRSGNAIDYSSQYNGYGPKTESTDNDSGSISPEYVPGAAYGVPGEIAPEYSPDIGPGYDVYAPSYGGPQQTDGPAYGGGSQHSGAGHRYDGQGHEHPPAEAYSGSQRTEGYGGMRPHYVEEDVKVEVDYGDGRPAQVISGSDGDGNMYETSGSYNAKMGYEKLYGGSSGHNLNEYQDVLNDVSQFSYNKFMPGSSDFTSGPTDYSTRLERYLAPPASFYQSSKHIKHTLAPYKYFRSQEKTNKKLYDVHQNTYGAEERFYRAANARKRKTNSGRHVERDYGDFGGRSRRHKDSGHVQYSDRSTRTETPYYGSMQQNSHSRLREWDDPFPHQPPLAARAQSYRSAPSYSSYRDALMDHYSERNLDDKAHATHRQDEYDNDSIKTSLRSSFYAEDEEGRSIYRKGIGNQREKKTHGSVLYPSYHDPKSQNGRDSRENYRTRLKDQQDQHRYNSYHTMKHLTDGTTDFSRGTPHTDWWKRMTRIYKDRSLGGKQRNSVGQSDSGTPQVLYKKVVPVTNKYPEYSLQSDRDIIVAKDNADSKSQINEENYVQLPRDSTPHQSSINRPQSFARRVRQKMLAGLSLSLKDKIRPDRETLLSAYHRQSGYGMRVFPFNQRHSIQLAEGSHLDGVSGRYNKGRSF